jgi:hypothetical protein
MIAEFDFDIVTEDNRLGARSDLEKFPLAPQFSRYRTEDLLIIESVVTARRR